MSKIRILITDDHDIVRDGLKNFLNEQSDMEVVGEACNGKEAIEMVKTLRPNVVLLDIGMPHLSGIDVIHVLLDAVPGIKIAMFSVHAKENFVKQSLAAGALGYVLKASPNQDIVDAVRSVYRGEYYLSAQLKQVVLNTYATDQGRKAYAQGYDCLSEREQQVFRLIAAGQSTNQIADFLCISHKTVEKHRTSIMNKLNIHNRFDLMKYAIKIGIVNPELWEE